MKYLVASSKFDNGEFIECNTYDAAYKRFESLGQGYRVCLITQEPNKYTLDFGALGTKMAITWYQVEDHLKHFGVQQY